MIVDLQDIPDFVINPCVNNERLGLWFNTSGFWDYLARNYRGLDIMTFTRRYDGMLPVRRMLVGQLESYTPDIDKTQLRFCPKLHTKLYLCYGNFGKLRCAYVGSLNYVRPTMHDLMIRVDDKSRLRLLKRYFDQMWEATDSKESI